MERFHIYVIAVYILVTFISFTVSVKWTSFERDDSLNGKACEDADIAFSNMLIYDKSACVLKCANHTECKSVFHTQHTGDCTGCSVSYGKNNLPTGLMDGSVCYQEKSDCPSGWSSFENSCYFITEEKTIFLSGLAKCESFDARPVIINNENENNFVLDLIKSTMNENDDFGFFTGFTDIETEGTWVEYGTNNQMTFEYWGNGEPNYGTLENCLAFFYSVDLKWIDISCNFRLKVICEINK